MVVDLHVSSYTGERDMHIKLTTKDDCDVAIKILKQMVWLQQELANAEERCVEPEDLISIRRAILRSIVELRNIRVRCR